MYLFLGTLSQLARYHTAMTPRVFQQWGGCEFKTTKGRCGGNLSMVMCFPQL